jgi:hypothetical protein
MAFSVIAVSISVSPFFTEEDRHVHHVGAEPLAGQLEGGLSAGGGFEEQVDLGAAAKCRLLLLDLTADVDRRFGGVEQEGDILGGKPLDSEKVPVRKCGRH